jgi:hypothetical protein
VRGRSFALVASRRGCQTLGGIWQGSKKEAWRDGVVFRAAELG